MQIDGSHHWWFENRGPKCALLVYIDDATGKFLHLCFAESENPFDYLHSMKAFWSDRASRWLSQATSVVFFGSLRPSKKYRTSGMIQFSRASYELNIDLICANTPQVKGRAGLANQTLLDRLGKELV